MNPLSLGLAVLAACINATSNVLQRTADRRRAGEGEHLLGSLLPLLREPIWLAGIGTVILSFIVQGAALTFGSLAAVQPVIVLELPLTVIFGTAVFRGRARRADWLAVGLMTAGTAAVLGTLAPQETSSLHVAASSWILGGAATTGAVAILAFLGLGRRGGARAALLGAAAGTMFGFTAALMKSVTARFPGGVGAVLSDWSLYAMAIAGIIALVLVQLAFQAGSLMAAQPGITLLDPLTAIGWGVAVFHEQVRTGPALLGAAGAIGALAAGAVLLSRSPLLASSDSGDGRAGESEARPGGAQTPAQAAAEPVSCDPSKG